MPKSFYRSLAKSLITFVLIESLVAEVADSSREVEVTGLGWHSPQLIFPSRYFFVWNRPLASVGISSPDPRCRVWHQLFNETDFPDKTLTIVRYKLLSEVCSGGIEISLFGDSKELLARRVVTEDIWSESCVCRRQDWSQLMGCQRMTQQFQQINSDLKY